MTDNQDVSDELKQLNQSSKRNAVRIALGVVAIIAIAGVVPWIFGAGFLATGMLGAEQLMIDVRNNGSSPVDVRVQRVAGIIPLAQSLSVPPQRQLSLTAREGDVRIEVSRGGEVFYETERTLDEHIFVSADANECFAIFDITGLYGDSSTWGYPVVGRMGTDDRIVAISTPHLILPGGMPPETIYGETWWIEEISCRTIANEDDDVLASIAETRWTQREIELQRARDAAAAGRQ